jgi:hypothetical protein
MKIRLLIFAFSIGFLSLAFAGSACLTKASTTFSSPGIKFKKDFVVGIHHKHGHGEKSTLLDHNARSLFTFTALPALKEKCLVMPCCSGCEKPANAETERLLHDHLLRLFPSHYFW